MTGISLFDVIGPNMVGPSSSHTAGAVSMALLARKMFLGVGEETGEAIKKVTFILYGSFARTYRGHGTDRALLGGMLGFETDDLRIRDAFSYAKKEGLEYSFLQPEEGEAYLRERYSGSQPPEAAHPNTADMDIEGTDGKRLFVRGISTGGGKVRITRLNKITVDFTGEYSTLIVSQEDRQGVAAHITSCLSSFGINIAFMRIFREEKGADAYTVVELDGRVGPDVIRRIRENPYITELMLL